MQNFRQIAKITHKKSAYSLIFLFYLEAVLNFFGKHYMQLLTKSSFAAEIFHATKAQKNRLTAVQLSSNGC